MTDVTPQQVWASRSVVDELTSRGVRLIGEGNERKALCPLHEDRTPSFSVNVAKNAWQCHAGCGGGSVVDLIARLDNRTAKEVYRDLAKEVNGTPTPEPKPVEKVRPRVVKIYSYCNLQGDEIFQVTRTEPKGFRQRHKGKDGQWVWNMDGVTRCLYRLPQITQAKECWVVEGEKDAENLVAVGREATCNVGGAGKWLDSYTETLLEKDVILCGDNDKPGQEHIQKILESISGKVSSVRVVKVPAPHKDISEYLEADPSPDKAALVEALVKNSKLLKRGIDLPLLTMAEMEERYAKFVLENQNSPVDLGLWMPSFRRFCRPLVPGDLVTVLAGTAVGKSAILQNMARAWAELPVVMFQFELSEEAMFERTLGERGGLTGDQVEQAYVKNGGFGKDMLENAFKNLLICTLPKLKVSRMEELCQKAELKLGQPPKVVMVDYLQLADDEESSDSRYAKFSNISEAIRNMAKTLRCVVVLTSQIKRKPDGEDQQVTLSDGKESGSIENSSSLLIGAWREAENEGSKMVMRILKNTRGKSGGIINCNWSPTLRITERSQTDTNDSYQTHP